MMNRSDYRQKSYLFLLEMNLLDLQVIIYDEEILHDE